MNLIPSGSFQGKTLCGDCIWIDLTRPDKSNPGYYHCKKRGKDTKIDLNTSCEYWTKR